MSELVGSASVNSSLPGGVHGSSARQYRRWSLAIAAASLCVGTVYAFVIPAGLPYDEPSYWSTVQFYADNARLPVMGNPGVTYEAQMGPVAYSIGGVVVRLAESAGASPEVSFRLVRLIGALAFAATVLLVAVLTRQLVSSASAALAAVTVFALNPMLLTMSASVQNDTIALLLGVLAIVLAARLLGERPTIGASILVGIVAGLGVLTKLTDWIVVVVIPIGLVWLHRKGATRAVVAFLLAVTAVSGWWFVRNIHLYGDPTGSSAVEKTGVSFDRYHVHGVSGAVHVFQAFVTYLWLPTEYLRNSISAPVVLKVAILGITIAVVILGIEQRRELLRTPALPFVLGCGLLGVTTWLVTYLGYQGTSLRIGYLGLPMWVALMALALTRFSVRSRLVLAGAIVVTLNLWTLHEVRGSDAFSFIVF